ncbi:MAG: radical SAM protein [Spirochaetota bacterium]|nr:radical SAM protein [Spirochaetota bacterium]
MKVLLINPPYAATEPPSIPMSLLYIGAALEDAGNEVRILDLLISPASQDVIQRTIENFDPAMVGITSVTMNWPEASRILHWVKQADERIYTVAGGPHATFTWKDIGNSEPWIDFVVLGEGEKTIIELVNKIEKNTSTHGIDGLAWRENGGMVAGSRRAFEHNLDLLPKPARHLFSLPKYRAMWTDARMSTGRGCPFSCAFCVGAKMVGHKPRLMSPNSVVDEIEDVVRLGFRDISFSDDHFGMKRSHAIAVCDEIINRGIDIDLGIFIRADAAEPELLDKMRRAGCTRILFGAESGVQAIVDRIRKKIDLNLLKEKVKLAVDMGFQVQVTFILGLPGETRETIEQTFEYAFNLGIFAGMHILAPLPGSEIYECAEELGIRILHRDWSLYDANHVVSEPKGISASELEKIIIEHEKNIENLEKQEIEAWRRGELTGSSQKGLDRRRCMNFYFELFRNGFFNSNACSVEINGNINPQDKLIKSAAIHANVDDFEASKWIKRAMDAGDLKIIQEGSKAKFGFIE